MDGAIRRADELRSAAITVAVADLDAARYDFHRQHPSRSAKRTFYVTQVLAFAALAGALIWSSINYAGVTFYALHVAALTLFASAIALRFAAAAHVSRLLTPLAAPQHWPIYTILCPLYREANVVADLVSALERLDYPGHALNVMLLVEGDDVDTMAAALACSAPAHIDVVIVPAAAPRTKPKALNVGLALARGEYVVVFDAEDRPHPQQLLASLAAFERGGKSLACVQAPLEIDNAEASWIARQFAAEYAIQFREILPLLARLKLPLPLGGTSNHFRTDVLKAAGGWDAFNVTEDADLGYRLAREGYRSDVIGPPTYEEAPVTFAAWLKQRTRWIKGHMQTWLVLMRDPVRTAREMGLAGFAAMQLMLGGGLAAAFAHGPLACIVLIAALSPYDLLSRADFALALFGYCVAVFSALTAAGVSGNLNHLRAALTMPFYWPLASVAAILALFELLFRPHHWAKTAHGVSPRARPAIPHQRSEPSSAHICATSASL
ncbi:MAG: glycosyltransferase [Phycisphaerales bacterium]|nr:glycosyltransferase [Hyphomonadaceae bacterium]